MKILSLGFAAALLAGCVSPMTAQGPTIRDSSGMEIRHERLGGKTHLVTVTDARHGIATRQASNQDMNIVANRFAASICPNGYDMDEGGGTAASVTASNKPFRTFVVKER